MLNPALVQTFFGFVMFGNKFLSM